MHNQNINNDADPVAIARHQRHLAVVAVGGVGGDGGDAPDAPAVRLVLAEAHHARLVHRMLPVHEHPVMDCPEKEGMGGTAALGVQ